MTHPPAAVQRVVHVTRLPPSPSGVAAYAQAFDAVLDVLVGPDGVTVQRLPADPAASQSVLLAARLTRRLLRATRRDRASGSTVVLVEQAGRGLAEFWSAWWLARRGRRVWLMVHDVPELSGGAFFSTLLDRRGGRRLAAVLSGSLGRAAERDLLARADRVLCLSPAGARALERAHRLTRSVEAVPHVAAAPSPDALPPTERREVLVPGYVAGAADVLALVRAAGGLPAGWTLVIGACSPQTGRVVHEAAAAAGVADRVRLLGFLDEAGVRSAFGRAAVVVRWRRDGWGDGGAATGQYAVSGPLVAAMAHGCAVVTNDTRGAAHLFVAADVRVVGAQEAGERALLDAVRDLLADPDQRARRGAAGRALVGREHTPEAIAALLRDGTSAPRGVPVGAARREGD
ncbi:MAG TPA: glycosyltransferase [Cellulomonas sp.]